MLTPVDPIEAEAFFYKYPDVEAVDLLLPDTNGILRGKRIPVRYFLDSVWTKGSNISDVIFGWDSADELIPTMSVTNYDTGGGAAAAVSTDGTRTQYRQGSRSHRPAGPVIADSRLPSCP